MDHLAHSSGRFSSRSAKAPASKNPPCWRAVIQLGNCFDLLDVQFTQCLSHAADELIRELAAQGAALPRNQHIGASGFDWLRRDRGCLVLDSVLPRIESRLKAPFHSVRSVFQEGSAAFDGAGIKMKSHIQIAVRNTQAILGYFLVHKSNPPSSLPHEDQTSPHS